MKRVLLLFAAALALAASQTYAGVFTANFDDGAVPPGSAVWGTTVVEPTGGVNNSGVLKLTKALPEQQGSFIIEDLDAAQPVNGFDLRFKLRMGGGGTTPADGFSFSVAPNLPNGTWGEEGAGGGLSVAFDIYDNGGGEAPAIDIKWPGTTELRHMNVPIGFLRTTNAYVDVRIKLDTDGSLDVIYNGTPVYTDLLLAGFQPTAGVRYGFGGRTGGAVEDQWIDDLQLTTSVGGLSPRFLRHPSDATVREGGNLTLRAEINDPNLVFPGGYQWFRRGPTEATFTQIAGANDTNYTAGPLTLADSGSQFYLFANTSEGELVTRTATVSVVSVPLPPAEQTFSFDDGVVPAGTAVFGNAMVTMDGGVDGSGVLRLTEAIDSQAGTFIIPDLDAGQAVESITVTFRPRVGEGETPPADGFSFSWANNIPDANVALGEEGVGNGLIVSFDIYEGAASPVVDVKFNGTNIASTPVTVATLQTSPNYGTAAIQLRADGRVYVVYNDVVLHNGVQIPGWSALANGRFAFAARTGGLNELHYIDDIGISTTPFAGALSFIRQPSSIAVIPGQTATFTADVNDPARATFQWQRRGPGEAVFSNIPGANSASYTTPVLSAADNGARYQLVATGPGNVITSDAATLTVINVARPTSPDIVFDFNECTVEPCTAPAGTTIYTTTPTAPTARVTPTGGTGDSGVLRLAEVVAGQGRTGAWVVDDFMGGQAIAGFTLAFNAHVDDGSTPPADGYSVSWGTDVPNGVPDPAEEGGGTGLVVSFDLWNSSAAGQPAEAPAIGIKWRGQTVVDKLVPTATIESGPGYEEVLINLEPDGTVDVVVAGEIIHNNVALPNFTALGGAKFGFAARTGGANNNYFFDDVAIDAVPFTGPISFIQEPTDEVVLSGNSATFSATVNDPARTTFQWQARAPGATTFTNIPGATSSSFTTPAMTPAETGTEFRLIATANNTITSRVARLTVITITEPTPTASYNFDDGQLPPGTAIFTSVNPPAGAGTIDATTGVLKLTVSPGAGHAASFIVDDLNAGAPVYGMTASFDTRIGGGTTPPADGMSFVWASDLPNAPFGEDGLGSGLVVTFDIYDNGGGEAPSIDITYRGAVVASTKVPASFVDTGEEFAPTTIRVEDDGTVDVIFKGEVVHHNVALPGFTNVVGGRFGWGARTGGLSANQWLDNIRIATDTTAAPRLSISRSGNNVTVSWTGGRLQAAPTITGDWADVQGADQSPMTFNNTTGMRFFRTVSP
jgi:hypothetical protein